MKSFTGAPALEKNMEVVGQADMDRRGRRDILHKAYISSPGSHARDCPLHKTSGKMPP